MFHMSETRYIQKGSLREVAKIAGVSIATVSRVLNGDNNRVKSATRNLVLGAVRELGYRPPAVRSTRSSSSGTISVIIGDIDEHPFATNSYFAGTFEGILSGAASRGRSVTIVVERVWRDVALQVRETFDGHCDGVVCYPKQANDPALRALWVRNIPIVMIGTDIRLEGSGFVDIDNKHGLDQLMSHLFDMGHRDIAYCGVRETTRSNAQRLAAFMGNSLGFTRKSVYLAAGETEASTAYLRHLEGDVDKIHSPSFRSNLNWSDGIVDAACEMGLPTAFICWNDNLAKDLIISLARRDIDVPSACSVVSFDDSSQATHCAPQITTLRQPLFEVGRAAVEMLIDRIDDPLNQTHSSQLFYTQLVTRGSSAPVPKVQSCT
jgi:LacI family transcriptional regulator